MKVVCTSERTVEYVFAVSADRGCVWRMLKFVGRWRLKGKLLY